MPNTIVVGDSVGLGISQAIAGSQFVGAEGRQLSQMAPDFNSAIAAAGQGDTIIISAGYNGAFSPQDVTLLTNSIQQMRQKGAQVVIAGLRETGMDAAINAQYAATNRQLQQVASATGAVFSNQCTTIGNGLPAGNVHGGYQQLAQACIAAANTGAAPAAGAAPATGNPSAEADNAQANRNSGGGIGEFFSGLWDGIVKFIEKAMNWLSSLFGGGEGQPGVPGSTPNAGTGGQSQGAPDERARAAARAAAAGSPAAGTGTDAPVSTPSLPAATGPLVRGA